ncbi:MAG: YIP1 family protein [Deltaproteobacteria bacterium]|nr:YIP1 family protein [Deltaproteobacteria bacterium]
MSEEKTKDQPAGKAADRPAPGETAAGDPGPALETNQAVTPESGPASGPDQAKGPGSQAPPPPPPLPGLPWETRKGILFGFPGTLRVVLFHPVRAFDAPAQGWLPALAFAVLITLLTAVLALVFKQASEASLWVDALIALPVNAVVVHVLLWALGSAHAPFLSGTFRTACYAMAPILATLVPQQGTVIIFVVWNLVIMILGLARVHRVSYGLSTAVNLFPLLIGVGLKYFMVHMGWM